MKDHTVLKQCGREVWACIGVS